MRSSRDDFPLSVKQKLAERAGFQCSKPDCLATTSGPHSDPEKAQNVGVAAHITAAAPGGARYDPTLTPRQRKSAANGIWMCRLHGTEVDNDEVTFPVELLREWKRLAELAASKRLGKPAVDPIAHAHLRDARTREMGPVINIVGDQLELLRSWGNNYRGDKALLFALQPYRTKLLSPGLSNAVESLRASLPEIYRPLSRAFQLLSRFEAMVEDSAQYERSRRPNPLTGQLDRSPGEIPGLGDLLDEVQELLSRVEAELNTYIRDGAA